MFKRSDDDVHQTTYIKCIIMFQGLVYQNGGFGAKCRIACGGGGVCRESGVQEILSVLFAQFPVAMLHFNAIVRRLNLLDIVFELVHSDFGMVSARRGLLVHQSVQTFTIATKKEGNYYGCKITVQKQS